MNSNASGESSLSSITDKVLNSDYAVTLNLDKLKTEALSYKNKFLTKPVHHDSKYQIGFSKQNGAWPNRFRHKKANSDLGQMLTSFHYKSPL